MDASDETRQPPHDQLPLPVLLERPDPALALGLAFFRDLHGLTVARLGAMAGVSGNAVARWLGGHPAKSDNLLELCRSLGVSRSRFFQIAEEQLDQVYAELRTRRSQPERTAEVWHKDLERLPDETRKAVLLRLERREEIS